MKHIIITLLLFGLTFSVKAQVYLGETDSIIVKRYYYRDKELSEIGSHDRDIFEELSSKKLTHKQEKISATSGYDGFYMAQLERIQ